MAVAQTRPPLDLTVDEEKKIVDELVTQYEDAINQYTEMRSAWLLNVHFAMGNQNVRVLPGTMSVVPAGDIPKSRVREVVNLIRPRVRMYVATATSREINWRGATDSGDLVDQIAATKSTAILRLKARQWKLRLKQIRAVKWACWTGTGYFMPYYDEDAGAIDPVLGFRLDAPSAFDIVPEPSAPCDEDCNWIYRVHLWNAGVAQMRYPEFKEDLVPDRGFEMDSITQSVLDAAQGQHSGYLPTRGERPKDAIVAYEFWQKANLKFPRGRRALLAGRRLLEYHDWPFDTLPPRPVYYEIVPGRYLGQSMVGGIIQTQKSFNRRMSAMLETLNYHSHPKIMVPKQAKLAKSAWTTEAGEKVHYLAPYVPTVVPPAPIHSANFQILSFQQAAVDSQTNQPEAYRGERVPGMRSGRGYALLQEKAVQAMGDTSISMADALSDVGQFVMDHWQARVPFPIAVPYLGQDDDQATGIFYASDVRKDIYVAVEDVEPESKEIKQANVRGDIQGGIITAKEARRHLGYSTAADRAYQTGHENEARAELAVILSGQIPPVWPWQDHEIHYDVHGLDFVRKRFNTWDESAKMAALEHMKLHDAQMTQAPQQSGGGPAQMAAPQAPQEPGVNVEEEDALRAGMGL